MKRRITKISLTDRRGVLLQPLKTAILADLHNGPFDDLLPHLRGLDCLLVPGDLVNRHQHRQDSALRFLEEAPKIAPVYYSLGNHELRLDGAEAWMDAVRRSRVILLDDRCESFRGDVNIGGVSSRWRDAPSTAGIEALSAAPGFRLLLCHHPEHFSAYVQEHGMDLAIAGHAHGGQIQLFGHGLYAPGQGLFPRLTDGFYFDKRLLVSRGLTNSTVPPLPRWGNPCELILLTIQPKT
ncbi:MAG: metallophosphoesterase [Clostridia bacterium]|nr:metallophosphoesterase [Clostridia bacterium]